MKFPFRLPAKVTRFLGKALLKAKGAAPEACVIGGLAVGGAALISVGVRTWKGKEKLSEDVKAIKEAKNVGYSETKQEVPVVDKWGNTINGVYETVVTTSARSLTDAEKKIIRQKKFAFAKDCIKIYWLPAVLGGSSVVMIWGGRTMLRKELSAATAAYAALAESYRKYRAKVIEEYGAEKDQELAYGVKTIEAIDAETGEPVKKTIVQKNGKDNLSPYAVWFDEGDFDEDEGEWYWKNHYWEKNKHQNQMTIRMAQTWANQQLISRGWVSLGEVYERMGLPVNPYWNRVGWIWTIEKERERKNFVEFRVFGDDENRNPNSYQLPINRRFMDLNDPWNAALIDPNVDGCIDCVFENPEMYDFRFGKNAKRRKGLTDTVEKLKNYGGLVLGGEEYMSAN